MLSIKYIKFGSRVPLCQSHFDFVYYHYELYIHRNSIIVLMNMTLHIYTKCKVCHCPQFKHPIHSCEIFLVVRLWIAIIYSCDIFLVVYLRYSCDIFLVVYLRIAIIICLNIMPKTTGYLNIHSFLRMFRIVNHAYLSDT